MELSRNVAEYRGRRYDEHFSGEDWIAVGGDPSEVDAGLFPDAIETGEGRQGPWVKLPKAVVSRRAAVSVLGQWRGETVGLSGPERDGTVLLRYNRDPAWARSQGMTGDQYNGWQLRVPVDEVEVTEVSERVYG